MVSLAPLFHCFGTSQSNTSVDTDTAIAMLRTSGCKHLAINTHSISTISSADALPIGYGSATFGSVRAAFDPAELTPVLNINMPTSASEAVERARRAHALTGEHTIKLEVLDHGLDLAANDAVVEAARILVADGLEIWPLITPDPEVAVELQMLDCPVIRIMGSKIGSGCGLDPNWQDRIQEILDQISVHTMLDGGIGTPAHMIAGLKMGFDSVLVNSCLFDGINAPITVLREFVTSLMNTTALARSTLRLQ